MTKYLKAAAAVGALAFAVTQASAAQISGDIIFAGTTVTVDNTSFPLVTTLDFPAGANATVVIATDGFAPYSGSVAEFSDFTIGASSGPLWSIPLVGAPAIQFKFDGGGSINVSPASNVALIITGTGTISGIGITDTPGSFTITAPRAAGSDPNQLQFSFNAFTHASPTPTTTPDGGATAMLLGIGALGVGMIARRK